MGCREISNAAGSTSTLHRLPMVQPFIISLSLSGKSQIPSQELLSSLDG
jgi:hypothetical protein